MSLLVSGVWQAKCSNIQFIYFIFNSIFHVQLFVQYSTLIQYSMLQFHSIRHSIFNYSFNVQLFINNVKNYVPINPFPCEWVLRALIDFTLSNARRFYSSTGNLLDGKGLNELKSSKFRSSRGSLFHSVGAATENDLSPKVRFVFWDGNASKMPEDERKL